MKIAFIGTGVMGHSMAGHLMDAGNERPRSRRTHREREHGPRHRAARPEPRSPRRCRIGLRFDQAARNVNRAFNCAFALQLCRFAHVENDIATPHRPMSVSGIDPIDAQSCVRDEVSH